MELLFFIDFGKLFFKVVVFFVESTFLPSITFWERSPSRQLKYNFIFTKCSIARTNFESALKFAIGVGGGGGLVVLLVGGYCVFRQTTRRVIRKETSQRQLMGNADVVSLAKYTRNLYRTAVWRNLVLKFSYLPDAGD